MWRFIVVVGLLEYKSVVWPFQHGDLSRLFAYGLLWRATHQRRESRTDGSRTERLAAHEITLLLAVPSINEPLRDELEDLGLKLPASTRGYHQVTGALLPLVVVDLHVVAELEDDDLLRGFAGRPQRTVEGRRWMRQHWSGTGDTMSTSATPDLYGYDEFIEQYLGDLTPKQRLKGLAPEERLQDLTEAEQVLALPVHLLRLLPDDYIATLPADVQAKVHARRETGS